MSHRTNFLGANIFSTNIPWQNNLALELSDKNRVSLPRQKKRIRTQIGWIFFPMLFLQASKIERLRYADSLFYIGIYPSKAGIVPSKSDHPCCSLSSSISAMCNLLQNQSPALKRGLFSQYSQYRVFQNSVNTGCFKTKLCELKVI